VALVGIRSLDEGEKRRLKETGVQVHTMSDIDRHGIHRVMKKALARITDGTDCVHVSFDLDAVDPTVAPGVGTPVKGGLDYREAHLIMELLHDSGVMTSLEMVEVNPILDDRNTSAVFAVALVPSPEVPHVCRSSPAPQRIARRDSGVALGAGILVLAHVAQRHASGQLR